MFCYPDITVKAELASAEEGEAAKYVRQLTVCMGDVSLYANSTVVIVNGQSHAWTSAAFDIIVATGVHFRYDGHTMLLQYGATTSIDIAVSTQNADHINFGYTIRNLWMAMKVEF